MIKKLQHFIFWPLIAFGFIGCQQDDTPPSTLKARASYTPYGSQEEVPLRWDDARLENGLVLRIAGELAAILDYGGGENGYTDAAIEWNNALPSKTMYALPFAQVANRERPQLLSYFDDEMGIYKSQSWYSEVGAGALAITQFFGVRRNQGQGQYVELQHADIILNYRDYTFTSDSEDFTSYDLPSVLLHEMGHFLGLRHEYSTYESIMRPSLGSFESERQLYPIDIYNLEVNYNVSEIQQFTSSPSEYANNSGMYASAITSNTNADSELIQGRFELRADGQCVHFINGKHIGTHNFNVLDLFNRIDYGLESI